MLAAVADGNATRGGIANVVGRKASDLQHPLTVLEDCGLLARDPDPFRSGRSSYRIAEPLIAFYQAIMRPAWTMLERRRGAEVWEASRRRFDSAIVGPHFEHLSRTWVANFAAESTLGGVPSVVSPAVVTDPVRRESHEIDIVALGEPGRGARPVLALGEAKWGREMGIRDLERLRVLRGVVAGRDGFDATNTKLICASGAGFSAELRAAGDVVLVDLDRLYSGD